MAGQEDASPNDNGGGRSDPVKAIRFKDEGNKCFQERDYVGAEALYVKAINADPKNPLLYTNRAMALLKLSSWEAVITSSYQAINLLPENMKAYYYIAQAQNALEQPEEALRNAELAHQYCVEEIRKEGKGGGSIGPITELVLKCRRDRWEGRERERERLRGGLEGELVTLLERDGERRRGDGEMVVEGETEGKVEELRRLFREQVEGGAGWTRGKRKMPDWVVDYISFNPMADPVVTKTGNSYERASIMKHLERSQTDPLTREPLTVHELRPNLALKAACKEFLDENGWAVDW